MTDVALRPDPTSLAGDLVLSAGGLETDEGLSTAIYISLFTDARAHDDDKLPDADADRRGWWGDAVAEVPGDSLGSRLWLLSREKRLASVVTRARQYAREALEWLVEEKVASAIEVEVEAQSPDTLAFAVTIDRPHGPARQRFDYVWNATA